MPSSHALRSPARHREFNPQKIMIPPRHRSLSAFGLCLLASPALAQEASETSTPWGHSRHGFAHDAGPRQKPWHMEGIGSTPFPISSSHPEVQAWFDQAIALLHAFWFYEAERSLRWCLKLDPECAMAYWGLAIATKENFGESQRAKEFLDQAVARKGKVSLRERRFIELLEKFHAADATKGEAKDEAISEAMEAFDRLLMDDPDDVEAKALYWLYSGKALGPKSGLMRYGLEAVLDDILEIDPDHVGALHYRVHNWDGKDGRYAIDTCKKLGEIAPRCGHLLHMPGHVLSGIGLWHEAAIAMDRATRVEKAYMNERLILPEDNWDYAHNLDYLCYIQEQLGMVDSALLGAAQLLRTPAFPKVAYFSSMVKIPMARALVKFERWDSILTAEPLALDPSNALDELLSKELRLRALIGLRRIAEAEAALKEFRSSIEKHQPKDQPNEGESMDPSMFLIMQAAEAVSELEARLQLARGEHLDGLSKLTEEARKQEERWANDPPHTAQFLYNALGNAYLELGAPKLAAACYEKTLETVFHDGFALAGLVVAYHRLGETEKAADAMARLGVVWSDAQRPNRWLEAAEATGIKAAPRLDAPLQQRNYAKEVLQVSGPSLWVPSDLPDLVAKNAAGETVRLSDHRGRNVLLIFYLGDECAHCLQQLRQAEERNEKFAKLDTVILAISQDNVEEIAAQQESFGLTLLSDEEFTMARRFRSYDDFEEIELHSTFLVDREGKLHWSRIGGEPFTDFDFLEKELVRMNRNATAALAPTPASK
ncbi:MAG: peroxiredoxin family protein [Planctomycetes bacterium]|nr:peroxiredoxin family protein [Planctomycetota bacterium]